MEITISEEKLKEIQDKISRHVVGCCLKRIDLFNDEKDVLKKCLKESIYEGFRVYTDSIVFGRTPGIIFK